MTDCFVTVFVSRVAKVNGEVWDVWDAVYPPKEKGALFLTTNYNLQEKQKRGVCSGSDLKVHP